MSEVEQTQPLPAAVKRIHELERLVLRVARERDAARAECERLREALEWYADAQNYKPIPDRDYLNGRVISTTTKINRDYGTRACVALTYI